MTVVVIVNVLSSVVFFQNPASRYMAADSLCAFNKCFFILLVVLNVLVQSGHLTLVG